VRIGLVPTTTVAEYLMSESAIVHMRWSCTTSTKNDTYVSTLDLQAQAVVCTQSVCSASSENRAFEEYKMVSTCRETRRGRGWIDSTSAQTADIGGALGGRNQGAMVRFVRDRNQM
jgi:hypothetical protein